jgi:hypothetical protein
MSDQPTDPRRPPIPLFHGSLGGVPRLSDDIPLALVALVDRFSAAMRAYADGKMSKVEVGDELARLRHTDEQGLTWTIGPSSGRWYARRGERGAWELADPVTGRIVHISPRFQSDT